MFRRILQIVVAVLIIMAGVKGYQKLTANLVRIPTKKRVKIFNKVTVTSVSKQDYTPIITGFGVSKGKREALVSLEIEGKVIKLGPDFQSGRFVEKGDLLLRIDDRSIKLRRKQLESEIKQFQVKMEEIKQEKENLENRLALIKDNLALAEKEFEKNNKLFKKGMVSENILDDSLKKYLSLKDSLVDLGNRISLIPIRLKGQQAVVVIKRDLIAETLLKLEKTVVKSPFDGLVYNRSIEVSQMVRVGQTVATLVDLSTVEISVDIQMKYLKGVNLFGQLSSTNRKYPCKVFWMTGDETVWPGYISRLEKIDQQARTAEVIIEVPQKITPKTLASGKPVFNKGVFCRVELPVKTYRKVVVISAKDVKGENRVFLLKDNKLEIREVKIAERFADKLVILSGLEEGELLITSPVPNPIPGMKLFLTDKSHKRVSDVQRSKIP